MLELVKLSQHCLLELVRLNSDPYSPRGNFVRVRKNKVKPNNAPYYFFRLASLKQARMKQMATAITYWIVKLYKYRLILFSKTCKQKTVLLEEPLPIGLSIFLTNPSSYDIKQDRRYADPKARNG